MHWLSNRVSRLAELAPLPRAARREREHFFSELASLVDEAGDREGVDVAFACHEGLLMAAAGAEAGEAEALAALAQVLLESLASRPGGLSLGDMRQLVVVGALHKLALVQIGPVTLGLRSPHGVSLARSTAT